MKKLLIAGLIASTLTGVAHSAQIEIVAKEKPSDINLIRVSGEFTPGDEKRFSQLAMNFDEALVLFINSPGGRANTGLEIGRIIRLKNFDTFAVGSCYSACAVAWAGGITRHVDSSAQIGFHNVFVIAGNGSTTASAAGNAEYGAFLNSVGFGPQAIRWASEKGANDFNMLTPQIANLFGIHAVFQQAPVTPTVAQPATPAPQPTLVKMCYRGSGSIGATARFDQSSPNFPGRQVVIVAEDPNRPSCNARNTGAPGRGVIVRVM